MCAIIDIVTAVATSIAAISGAYSAYTVKKYNDRVSNSNRVERTYVAYTNLEESTISQLYRYTSIDLFYISEHSHSEEYKIVTGYMNSIETFALGLETGYYDESVLDNLVLTSLTKILLNLNPIISKKRTYSRLDDYRNLEHWRDRLCEKYPNIKCDIKYLKLQSQDECRHKTNL